MFSVTRLTPLAVAVLVIMFAAPAHAEVVPSLPGGGWSVLPETTAGGAAVVVNGPGQPPAGTGSLRLSVAASEDRALVGTELGELQVRPWSGLSASFSTFVASGDPESFTPTLRFAGFQVITPTPSLFTTLSFEPKRNGVVVAGQWQPWTLGPASVVWQSNATDGFCLQSAPCAFADFVARYPDGAWGQAQLGLGSGVAGPANGYADAVTITDRTTVQFTDFDAPPPVSPPPSSSPSPEPSQPVGSEAAPSESAEILPVTGSGSGLPLAGVVSVLFGASLLVAARHKREQA